MGTLLTLVVMLTITAGPSAAGASAAPGDPVKGEAVYTMQKCNVCHRINNSGGVLAPDLTDVGGRRNAAWLAKFLPNPVMTDKKYKVPMPVPNVRGADMDNLIAYLLTLKVKK
jgi:cytochrome c2